MALSPAAQPADACQHSSEPCTLPHPSSTPSRLHPEGAEHLLPPHSLPAEVRLCGKLELLDRVLFKLRAGGHKVGLGGLSGCVWLGGGRTAVGPRALPAAAPPAQARLPLSAPFLPSSLHLLPLQVLLFSTMTRALDVIEDHLGWRGLPCLRLDGSTSSAERGELVDRFNDPGGWVAAEFVPVCGRSVAWRASTLRAASSTGDTVTTALPRHLPLLLQAAGGVFCFLLSIRAGGVGLNLQGADTVIMYDTGELPLWLLCTANVQTEGGRSKRLLAWAACYVPSSPSPLQSSLRFPHPPADFNPQMDLQAQARAHRMGQTREASAGLGCMLCCAAARSIAARLVSLPP